MLSLLQRISRLADWLENVHLLMDSSKKWACGCSQVFAGREGVQSHWYPLLRARHDQCDCANPVDFNRNVVSFHEVVDTCTGVRSRIPIEPLVGMLRNPLFELSFCKTTTSFTFITDKRYLMPMWHCEADATAPQRQPPHTSSTRRRYMFDLGASVYQSVGHTGGTSQGFFMDEYTRRGLTFDRILAWEATPYSPEVIFSMPPGVLDRISYMNLPINVTPGALHNPLRMLRAIAEPHDFVVLKLDIDTNHLEEAIIHQIIADSSLAELIDELYFEQCALQIPRRPARMTLPYLFPTSPRLEDLMLLACSCARVSVSHTHESPMRFKGWFSSLWTREGTAKTTHTLADSYRLFSQLRHLGIRAHSWV